MDYDKNTILAFVLIFLVLIAYWMYFSPKVDQQPVENQQITRETPPDTTQITTKVEPEKIETKSESAQETQDKFYPFLVNADDVSKEIIVESDFFRAIFSTRGAIVKSWRLKNYAQPNTKKVDGKIPEANWVELIGPNKDFSKYFGNNVTDDLENYNYGNLALSLPTKFGNGETQNLPFQLENSSQSLLLSKNHPVDSLVFVLNLVNGGVLRKKFIFYNQRYDFDLRLELKKINQHLSQSNYQLNWRSGLSPTEENLDEDLTYTKGYALPRKEIITFEVSDDEEASKPIIGKFRWIGTTTKYFGLSLVPQFAEKADSVSTEVLITGEDIQLNAQKKLVWRKFQIGFKIKNFAGDMISHQYKIYLGPLDYFILKDYDLELERLTDLGKWLRPICIGVLYLFKELHKYISNYGLVLIIFSILVKILLHPLTKKSYVSMKKMQELQPELTRLKEQCGNDAKKLQQAQLKLYKDKGINPLGGCLPTLLQLPLLFALYQVFRNTIALRGEPFIWWIKDLSMPDTIFTLPFSIPFYGDKFNILPIAMCAVMFIQQKMTVQDPKQKAMVYLMPVMMLLFFNQLSSGLNLYYTLFNVLSLGQQMLTKTDITANSNSAAKITPEKVVNLSQPLIKKSSKKKKN
jgi:YidC/Oxa1 family membrane protein insertase